MKNFLSVKLTERYMLSQILFLLAYVVTFLLLGLLHVLLYGVPFTDSIMLILYGSIAFLWGISIGRRIMDSRIKHLLFAVIGLIELFFLLQICNYKLFTESITLKRYCWYAYYVPMVLIPLLLFYISLSLNRTKEKKLPRLWYLPAVLAVIIAVGFLTNDLHFQAFSFLEPIMLPTAKKTYGPVYYLYVAFISVFAMLSFFIMIQKSKVTVTRRFAWVPVIPLLLGACLLITKIVDTSFRIHGIALWNMGEVFYFMTLGVVESCIRIGLIPANIEYETIFRELNMQARIYDSDGRLCFSSGEEEAYAANENMSYERALIQGGAVSWGVDISELIALDKQLREATDQLEARNAILQSENEWKKESSALAARNRLYDTIAGLLKPQMNQIQLLLKEARNGDFAENLKKISVLNAYIKRRGNMTLLLADSPVLPLAELILAMEESLSCVELCDVATMLSSAGDGELPGEMITLAYDYFQAVLEASFGKLRALNAAVICRGESLVLRLMFSGEHSPLPKESWRQEALEYWHGRVDIEEEGTDTVINLRLLRGGDSKC